MVEIKELCEYIEEEIADARKYAEKALKYKESNPDLAKRYYTTSLHEMDHMKGFHEEVTKIIADYRKTDGEPPAPMMAIYDWEHKKFMASAAEVKVLQSMFKDG